MRVSVVITNHNYVAYVERAAASALAQDVPAHEVIIVDDGSTDGSCEVIRRLDDVKVVEKDNGGQASAFNAGFATASGDVVVFLDADDVLFPDAVGSIIAAFADDKVGRVQFRLRHIDAADRRLAGSLPEPGRRLPVGDLRAAVLDRPDDIAWQPTSGNAFRRDVLEAILPAPEAPYRISADHHLSALSPLYGDVAAIERDLGGYRVHGANADHRDAFDVARARDIIVRSEHTHRSIVDHATRLGLIDPGAPPTFESSTLTGLRLVSLRAAPDVHPVDDDTRFGLASATVRALLARTDLTVGRKALGVGWTMAVAVAPRRLVPHLAGTGLTR